MLHELDKTLENILREDGNIPKKDIDIEFDQPTGEWSAKLGRPALNLWAFDIRENVKLRRADLERGGRNGRYGVTTKPARRMDVAYLVTSWARKPEDEHALLWRALSVLKNLPEVPLERCEGDLAYSNFPLPLSVADMTHHSFNVSDLWSVLENQMKLGFLTVVTMELASDFRIEAPLVLEGTFSVEQI